jgi:hypothetical protein
MKCSKHNQEPDVFLGPPSNRRWYCSVCLWQFLEKLGLTSLRKETL